MLIKNLIRHRGPLVELPRKRAMLTLKYGIGTRDVKPPLNAPGTSQSRARSASFGEVLDMITGSPLVRASLHGRHKPPYRRGMIRASKPAYSRH